MYEAVLTFWFEELEPAQWWAKDDKLDILIRDRFSEIHTRALRCELFTWRTSARGRLAEILVLDQFSRNIFRDSPQAFAADPLALALAQEAVSRGAHHELTAGESSFLFMPYMHSESLEIHEVAVKLFKENGIEDNLRFEIKHKEIIERFGHYPNRNKLLGRESSSEELAFLQQPGSGF